VIETFVLISLAWIVVEAIVDEFLN